MEKNESDGRQGDRGLASPWNGPRTVLIPRTDRGFGFTLRHFIVYPPEPKEREYISEDDETEELYFQRIQQGNLEPLDTIFVKNVKDGGPAQKAGLNPGDRIISVNGEPVTGKSYGQVINLIQQSSSDLSLLVVPKEEDILQLAYQNSSSSYDSDYGSIQEGPPSGHMSRGLNTSQHSYLSSMENTPYLSNCSRDRDRKVLSTSNLDSRYAEGVDNFTRFDQQVPRRTLTTSSSYTSGLSIYREPPSDDNMNKALFLDRKREFEARAAQENVNPNMSKTYSFGLYFPKKEVIGSSAENLSKSVVIRRSRESVLQPTDSQENITKTSRTRNVPIEYRHSGTPDQKATERYRSQEPLSHDSDSKSHHGAGSSIRHSFPDSGVKIWTSPTRRTSETSSPYSHEYRTATPETVINKRESYAGTTRQYVPVINESSMSRNPKMSASVDSIDPRSNVFHSEHQLRTAFNNSQTEQNNQNQSSPSRTFIVKIEDSKERAATPNISANQAGNQSYGAAFALTRSPASTEIEIRQKSEPRILVSHRKKQFEKPPRGDSNASPSGQSRFKTEMEKMTYRKYDGVQARLASFEKQGNGEPMRSRSQTPVSAQPISKVRRLSQERIKSPDPLQNSASQGTSQSNFTESAPIRIYVSQGNSNSSGSPIVEIVPVQSSNYDLSARAQGQYVTHSNQTEPLDTDGGQKPVRKASFLSAVNAPYSRYLPDTGYDNETPGIEVTPKSSRVKYSSNQNLREGSATPTNFQRMGQGPNRAVSPTSMVGSSTSITITTTAGSPTTVHEPTSVRLRSKPEISAEDIETKLHRRTSYLMATAKDRSAASVTTSPTPGQPLDPSTPATLNKHKSMRKLKDFFGEKTPKIVEAQEKKQELASPIQHVTKEGNLGVKMDMLDGKKASDRSWRTFWAVLRAHALFLLKEKRDPANQPNLFSYEEQPISVKSCIVDIAHGYTKKKNVFRVKTYNGSEYLFQADDHEEMLSWIEAIKSNSNPDEDTRGITSAELIIRKSQEVEESAAPVTKTSPPQSQKMTKKLSVLSIKQKIPHSPNLKRRKTTSDKDDSGKHKTWKGKIGKSFRKLGSSPASTIPTVQEVGGTFGVPLEECTPSPHNEFVPLLVDLCIQIMEARGLEMVGVYRIPGNKAGVTMLQDEFNKGIEAMNLDLDKWADINVISSLLKAFFRALPEPLIPDDLYQPFIDANRIENPERRMLKLKKRIHELPEHHFETFKHLAKHLNKVALYGDVNRMEARNLAIVFGPSLIRKADDNMLAMVTDMSDHCKILESIILHCEWFFGSWDMDNYIPTEEDVTECTSIMSAQTGSSREDLDSINPKEIVVSIVEAANRKMKGEEVVTEKRTVTISEPPPPAYNERNIDQEIIFRRKIDNTSRSSPNLSGMQRTSEIIQPTKPEAPPDRRMAKSQDFEQELSGFEYMDADKDNPAAYLTPTTRYFSDESLLDKNDELEMSHGTQSTNYRLSRETLNSLRRIELEARALREREERRQRDLEKRKLEKQRIEQDILQTQQEMEIEDRHSVEDLLNAQYSQYGFSDYYNNKRKLETDLLRNSNSSGRKVGSSGKYGVKDSPGGGKYFVIKGNTQSVRDERLSRPPRQTSVESLVTQSKRTSSLENMTDGHHGHGHRPLAHVRARKGDHAERLKGEGGLDARRRVGLNRSSSMRRGSLDSLIDLIEKRDNRMSWASTDSEDGYDLLTTLTSTFDQKLQTLSSQKVPQITSTSSTPGPRHSPYVSSNTSINTSSTTTQDSGGDPQGGHSNQTGLPPQVPLSMMNRQVSASELPAKQFRDPSLHRTPPKTDAKIGLATRFERSTTYNPLYSEVRNTHGVSLQSDLTYTVENATVNIPSVRLPEHGDVDSRVSSVMVVISSPSVMSADSQQSCGHSVLPQFSSKPVMSSVTLTSPRKWEPKVSHLPARSVLEYRPITKSEKTEVNVKLSKTLSDKNKNDDIKNKSISQAQNQNNFGKSRSASPPPSYRNKRSEKRKRRRHTVGGTNDSEHMNALQEATSKEQRLSAWEQLRPVVSESSNIGPSSNMMSWLQNERVRGSNPDLLAASPGEKITSKRN